MHENEVSSLIIGAAAAAVVIFGTGAMGASTSASGRYQMCIGGNGTAGVCDSITGQVWTAVISSNNGQATTPTIGGHTFLTEKDN